MSDFWLDEEAEEPIEKKYDRAVDRCAKSEARVAQLEGERKQQWRKAARFALERFSQISENSMGAAIENTVTNLSKREALTATPSPVGKVIEAAREFIEVHERGKDNGLVMMGKNIEAKYENLRKALATALEDMEGKQ